MFRLLFLATIAISGSFQYVLSDYGPSVYGNGPFLPYEDQDSYSDDDKPDFHKLGKLRKDRIIVANVKYYHTENGHQFALITCKPSPTPNQYVWIMVETDEKELHPSIARTGVNGTVPLAGGFNVTYAAEYARDGKWTGRDFYVQKLRKFRRVGCLLGVTTEVIQQS